MTISRIEVNEYQCVLCGYEWINRVNGKDGPVPKRCAKCKRFGWNGVKNDIITPQESGLRTRVNNFKKLYFNHDHHWYYSDDEREKNGICWPNGLCKRFLSITPRPTIKELKQILHVPGGLGLNSQNQYRRRGYVPDPSRLGWMKYDKKEYLRLLKLEAQKRQEFMEQIINSRQLAEISKAAE